MTEVTIIEVGAAEAVLAFVLPWVALILAVYLVIRVWRKVR